jgi:hypothetical protein
LPRAIVIFAIDDHPVHDGLERLAMVGAARGDHTARANYRKAADFVHEHADCYDHEWRCTCEALDASRATAPSETTPVVLADTGVENVNAQVHDLIATGVLRRALEDKPIPFHRQRKRRTCWVGRHGAYVGKAGVRGVGT